MGTLIPQLVLDRKLTAENLATALLKKENIDAIHPSKGKTALCIAVGQGDERTVRLLLDNNAKPNEKMASDFNRTALWYATNSPTLKLKDSVKVIRHLILYGADPNVLSECKRNTSPLMNTVKANNLPAAKEAAKLLLKMGDIEKDLQNKKKETALSIAKSPNLAQDAAIKSFWLPLLKPNVADQNILIRGLHLAMGKIGKIIKHTASIIDKVTGGRFSRIFGTKGVKDKTLAKKPAAADPKNPEELKREMIDQIHASGLEEFFPPDSQFLETVIEKAAALANRDTETDKKTGSRAFRNRKEMPGSTPAIPSAPPKPRLSNPANVKKLTHLSLYQPILFLDNSISMKEQSGVRIKVMHEIVERVLRVTTELPPDDSGVLIRLLHPNAQKNPQDLEGPITQSDIPRALKHLEEEVDYTYCTPLGTNLKAAVLEKHVYKPIRDGAFERPVLISIITDGAPNSEKIEFEDCLRECRQFLFDHDVNPKSVRFHLSQVGNDASAATFLSKIRDDPKLQDIVYVATDRLDDKLTEYRENSEQLEIWLMQTLLGPILDIKEDAE